MNEQSRNSQILALQRDTVETRQFEEQLQKAHNELEIRVQERTAELARSNAFIAALSQVAARLAAHPDPNQVMNTLGNELAKLKITCAILQLEPDTDTLTIRYHSIESSALKLAEKLGGLAASNFRLPRNRFPIYDDLVRDRRALYGTEALSIAVSLLPDMPKPLLARILQLCGVTPTARLIFLPLIVEEQIAGVLVLWGDNLVEGDVAAASTFASQVAASTHNAELFEQVQIELARRTEAEAALRESEQRYRSLFDAAQRQAQELALLGRVQIAVAQELDLAVVLRAVVETTAQAFGYTFVSVYWLQGDVLKLQHQVGYGQFITEIPITQGVTGYVARTGRPVLLQDVAEFPGFLAAVPGIVSEVCVPLIDQDGVVGVLNVESTQGMRLTQDDLRLMLVLSEQISIAVGKARLYAQARESEMRLRRITDNMSDVVGQTDVQWVCQYISSSVKRVLGYEPEQLLGKLIYEWVHPDDLAGVLNLTQTALVTLAPATVQCRYRHADGHYVWVETTGSLLLGEDGQVSGAIFSGRDITGRKQAEEALRESEERFRSLYENSTVGLYRTTPEGQILLANPTLVGILGYSSFDELAARNLAQEGFEPSYNRAQFIERIEKEGEVKGLESGWTRQDGTALFIRESACAIRNLQGKTLYYDGTVEDITERKQMEMALQRHLDELVIVSDMALAGTAGQPFDKMVERAMENLNRLWPNANVGFWFADETGESLRLYSPQQNVLPKILDEIRIPLTASNILCQAVRERQPIRTRNTAADPLCTGRINSICSEMAAPLMVNERIIGAIDVASTQDGAFSEDDLRLLVTLAGQLATVLEKARLDAALTEERISLARRVEERTAELSIVNAELLKAARAKDEFLATMSHELRTPLNTILGMCEALQEQIFGPQNEKQLKWLHIIEESGRHLLSLINDILDLAKIGAGKVELQLGPVMVALIGQVSLQFIKEAACNKQITVSSTFDSQVITIQADERRLKQILVNLLNNAVKFTSPGGAIGLEVVGDAAQQMVHFTVWDTGIGIAPENIGRLFQPFVQLDSNLSRQYTGTGLGLALVKRLAELHGGNVSVESKVGQGSRFTVSLPWKEAIRPEDQEQAGNGRAPLVHVPAGPSFTILLAEDNEANADALSEYLSVKGHRVLVAHDGNEAVRLAQQDNPDVILMDIQMPGLDGLEAIRCIRAASSPSSTLAEGERRGPPVIALTALAMPGDRERCMAAGADMYLSKPVSMKQMMEAIQALVPR